MRKIEDVILKNGKNLKEVLELHKKWLEDEEGGKGADLSDEDLSYVDLKDIDLRYVFLRGAYLRGAYLRGANLESVNLSGANLTGAYLRDADFTNAELSGANLTDANLSYANLSYAILTDVDLIGSNLIGAILTDIILICANLSYANLSYANLTYSNLKGANLTGAYLIGANLTGAKLTGANLKDAGYNNTTASFKLQCPEEGSFIGYKKANGKIVKLLITEDAKRSSATTRKCRCNKAKVLSITSLDGKEEYTKVNSDYDPDFVYEVGKVIKVKDFDENRWNECSNGIHFFITRDEAIMY